ncbi:MAG: LuxR family transcriptional regulator [Spirochaetaceae bacterium]|nr:LuxR family transcriptional regulator [Spirochaetaceae bacterium]
MIIDLILVLAGIVIFIIPAVLQKQRDFSKAAVLSGSFVTTVKLVILISEIERNLSANNGAYSDYSISAFLLMVFVNFRPVLLGVLIKLILLPFEKKQTAGAGAGGGADAGLGVAGAGAGSSAENTEARAAEPFAVLSPREKEVARLAARGYSNAQIAEELYISVETVKRHMATIFEKLDIKSRKDLRH